MSFLEALILGIIEGITEFLPVSSTAHLVLANHLLGTADSEFAKSFEIIIQLGAILSVVALYWRKLLDVDLQSSASELFGINRLSGRGNLNVSLVGSGSSAFALMQSLDGTATLNGHDGAISGFNVEQLLRRVERRPLSGAGSFRGGSTPFDNLTVSLKFTGGTATTDDVHMEGPNTHITLKGTVSVPSRNGCTFPPLARPV